jgi:hypothetical protein
MRRSSETSQGWAPARFLLPGAAEGKRRGAQRGQQREIGMRSEEIADLALVLLGRKRAGGIHEDAPRRERLGRRREDLRAEGRALPHQRRAVLADGLRLLAEHALARAGRIHEHPVEKGRQRGRDAPGAFVEHDRVGGAHALEVLLQDFGAVGHELVGHQQAAAAQRGRQLAAFAAGRRAQIQHAHAGAHIQQRRGRGGRRLLRIEHPRRVVRVAPRAEIRRAHHKTRRAKRRRLDREIGAGGKLGRRAPQRRHRHAAGRLARGRRVQRLVPGAEQRALPRLKVFERHFLHRLFVGNLPGADV